MLSHADGRLKALWDQMRAIVGGRTPLRVVAVCEPLFLLTLFVTKGLREMSYERIGATLRGLRTWRPLGSLTLGDPAGRIARDLG